MESSHVRRQMLDLDFSPFKQGQALPFQFNSPAQKDPVTLATSKKSRLGQGSLARKTHRSGHTNKHHSEIDVSHPIADAFKKESEEYLGAVEVTIDAKFEAIYRNLLEAANGLNSADISTKCTELQMSIQALYAPLGSAQLETGLDSSVAAKDRHTCINSALEHLAEAMEKQRNVFNRLSAEHTAINKKIQQGYQEILALTLPAVAEKGRRHNENLSTQLREHSQQLRATINEVETKGLDAIKEQLKFEDKERRKIDDMLQRLWD